MAHANSASMISGHEELGAYRSLSTLAVISFVLGLLSILSFAPSWMFVFMFPPAAVVLGLLALRQVKAAPEVWTGLRLAKLGIGLGLVCGLGATAVKYVDSMRIGKHGRIIADRFIHKLKAGDTEGAFWLKYPREGRAGYLSQTPDDVSGELGQQYMIFHGEADSLSKALARGEATVDFETVEQVANDRGTEYAAVLYKIRSPKEDTHVLVLASSVQTRDSRDRSWFIRELRVGYTPNSYEESQRAAHVHEH